MDTTTLIDTSLEAYGEPDRARRDTLIAGLDVAELDGEGRLRRVVGFFGPLPDAG